MWNSGIQGEVLEVTVVGCNKLKDTEWISRQDPYVCLEYASTKYRTRTHTDGGKNPVFQEKFVFTLIEGLTELNVLVWNSNTITYDDFIGSGKIQLHRVLTQGFDDSAWTIHTKTGRSSARTTLLYYVVSSDLLFFFYRYAGEVRLILHCSRPTKPATSYAPSAPPYGIGMSHSPQVPQYPPSTPSYAHPPPSYPAPSPYPAYPPPPSPYPPPPPPASYAPPYAPTPSSYPPAYPSNYPPGPYHGAYPRPPY